ncbi:hypothetical protein [Peromfec virus RodF8_22]|uniref:Uncharacterized protein n=1 Tax=Peromfec virus RodF8_22 TaxID=2929364 RepID=A0A976N355_9VIRU|nr:hypothetical protein [Peromfec virus RodF8_22]
MSTSKNSIIIRKPFQTRIFDELTESKLNTRSHGVGVDSGVASSRLPEKLFALMSKREESDTAAALDSVTEIYDRGIALGPGDTPESIDSSLREHVIGYSTVLRATPYSDAARAVVGDIMQQARELSDSSTGDQETASLELSSSETTAKSPSADKD